MPPIITLLTDFGTADSYVAEMQGVLLSAAPGAVLVDVTHEIPPGDVRAASFILSRVWPRFPAGTVHLAVVDPGVGTTRRALAGSRRRSRRSGDRRDSASKRAVRMCSVTARDRL